MGQGALNRLVSFSHSLSAVFAVSLVAGLTPVAVSTPEVRAEVVSYYYTAQMDDGLFEFGVGPGAIVSGTFGWSTTPATLDEFSLPDGTLVRRDMQLDHFTLTVNGQEVINERTSNQPGTNFLRQSSASTPEDFGMVWSNREPPMVLGETETVWQGGILFYILGGAVRDFDPPTPEEIAAIDFGHPNNFFRLSRQIPGSASSDFRDGRLLSVAPVPVPPAVLLFISALIALPALARMRRSRT